ncbi:MAG: FAD-linked oxidase C-terminal domain-containing protein [Microthrixaceae bacterium]
MEVSGPWSVLPRAYDAAIDAISQVEGNLAVSAHCSHSYIDGGCLYFTFAGKPPERDSDDRPTAEGVERYYRSVWDAGTRAVLAAGGSLSHHHGIGLNRGRYMAEALGTGFDVLAGIKRSLDPNGILNPGKLGLVSAFGPVGLP